MSVSSSFDHWQWQRRFHKWRYEIKGSLWCRLAKTETPRSDQQWAQEMNVGKSFHSTNNAAIWVAAVHKHHIPPNGYWIMCDNWAYGEKLHPSFTMISWDNEHTYSGHGPKALQQSGQHCVFGLIYVFLYHCYFVYIDCCAFMHVLMCAYV